MKNNNLIYLFTCFVLLSCNYTAKSKKTQKNTLFVGIDVSGSFASSKSFTKGISYLSYYIYGHLQGKGDLTRPTDLYVGGIGGNEREDPQAFFPIHDFDGLSPKKIEEKLVKEFSSQRDNLTDFNTFFLRIKTMVKQKNLVLSPISIVMLTDGVPEIARGKTKRAIKQAYSKINLEHLEYLARNISIRILYATPKVGNNWRSYVPTSRIKIWTIEPETMNGWTDQLARNGKSGLWKWTKDNIDLRIRSRGI
jgi:hypothetical protein